VAVKSHRHVFLKNNFVKIFLYGKHFTSKQDKLGFGCIVRDFHGMVHAAFCHSVNVLVDPRDGSRGSFDSSKSGILQKPRLHKTHWLYSECIRI
jgi:hypothetical protein